MQPPPHAGACPALPPGPCTVAQRSAALCVLCRDAATNWGLQVLRYEIRDITPPSSVRHAMDLQAEAERRKRAQVCGRGAKKPSCAFAFHRYGAWLNNVVDGGRSTMQC